MAKYVTLKIVDHSADKGEQELDTFILIDPDPEKLVDLQYSVETRHDNGYDNIVDFGYIYDYIYSNFKIVNTEYFEIEW